jgi:hypothetical protein
MIGNRVVNFLLHTPLRPIFGDTMQITVTGRKTGKHYSLPVGFFEQDGFLWVMSARDRTWWRNVSGGSPVDLYLRGETYHGLAEAVLDEPSVRQRLCAYLKAVPMAARMFGVDLLAGDLDPLDAERLVKERLFIRIKLSAN